MSVGHIARGRISRDEGGAGRRETVQGFNRMRATEPDSVRQRRGPTVNEREGRNKRDEEGAGEGKTVQGSNRNQSEGRSEPDSARQCRGPTASSQTTVRGKITLKFEHYKMAGSGGGLVGVDRGGDEGGRASCFLCVGSGRRRGGNCLVSRLSHFAGWAGCWTACFSCSFPGTSACPMVNSTCRRRGRTLLGLGHWGPGMVLVF